MDLLKKGLEEFQSTLPVWAATRGVYVTQMPAFISIHAARVGSDRAICLILFQSTLPVWAATVKNGGIACQ